MGRLNGGGAASDVGVATPVAPVDGVLVDVPDGVPALLHPAISNPTPAHAANFVIDLCILQPFRIVNVTEQQTAIGKKTRGNGDSARFAANTQHLMVCCFQPLLGTPIAPP